jgi:spermidine synthase
VREWLATVRAFRRVFPIAKPYLGYVPIYPGMLWSWVIGSDEVDPVRLDELSTKARLEPMRSALRIYTPSLHRAAFALPAFLHKLLERSTEDERPLSSADLRAAGHPLPGLLD